MNKYQIEVLKKIKSLYSIFFGEKFKFEQSKKLVQLNGQAASDLIKEGLLSNTPFFAARLGSTELNTILAYHFSKEPFINKIKKYITGESIQFWLDFNISKNLSNFSGFFPNNNLQLVQQFCELYFDNLTEIDVLGSWQSGEIFLQSYLSNAVFVELSDLEPYYHVDPWSIALKDQKVLVIHPFDETIKNQYFKNRSKLFSDSRILPEFELITVKAIQSIAGNKPTEFKNWFEALGYMQSKIEEIDFDIAIIGCGAYGLPLGAYIKKIGKKAVHLGGATQILFGIKGKRWDHHEVISALFNPYWAKPNTQETPRNHKVVEEGCYW